MKATVERFKRAMKKGVPVNLNHASIVVGGWWYRAIGGTSSGGEPYEFVEIEVDGARMRISASDFERVATEAIAYFAMLREKTAAKNEAGNHTGHVAEDPFWAGGMARKVIK